MIYSDDHPLAVSLCTPDDERGKNVIITWARESRRTVWDRASDIVRASEVIWKSLRDSIRTVGGAQHIKESDSYVTTSTRYNNDKII
jgi:hypothetical protein